LRCTNQHSMLDFLFLTALRDQRYKLVRYSEDELSIQLSNVTVHDEGVYKCFYYGIPFKSKNKTVEILAPPSNPVLEVSQDTERSITLSCYTQGCKPQPQITWLLDNGMELSGDTKHKLEADGKKWTTTSTLTVLAYGPNSTASCIIHHQALRDEKLMATFWFEDLPKTGTAEALLPSENVTVSSINFGTNSLMTTSKHSTSFLTPSWFSLTTYPPPNLFQDVRKSEGIKKKENKLLLPILVAALIFVLLIIVLLFMKKLKKAHGVWKRDNDVSEQTLESYKSKSIEDTSGHEKIGH
ncbi:CRTAM protein, partial [Urocolius indicus]|nr:CRTAM protein [Urocolius indicus]